MIKKRVLIASIPIIFIVGIITFFLGLPPDVITITNFVAYTSSLSTVIMVLIYLFTNSQQLNVMQNQLDEMKFSRNVQIQPLPYLEGSKAIMDLSRFYVGPGSNFKKMRLMCRLFLEVKATNIGNGPAVAVDFIPKLYEKVPKHDNVVSLVDAPGKRIECISLREGDSQNIMFLFFDCDAKVVEIFLKNQCVLLFCVIVYKNSLGMAFRENVGFWVSISTEDEDKIRSCLKIKKTAEIDFGKKVKEYEHLMNQEKKEQASKIMGDVNQELAKQFNGQEEIKLGLRLAAGSFSVIPISQSDYRKLIDEKEEITQRIISEY